MLEPREIEDRPDERSGPAGRLLTSVVPLAVPIYQVVEPGQSLVAGFLVHVRIDLHRG